MIICISMRSNFYAIYDFSFEQFVGVSINTQIGYVVLFKCAVKKC